MDTKINKLSSLLFEFNDKFQKMIVKNDSLTAENKKLVEADLNSKKVIQELNDKIIDLNKSNDGYAAEIEELKEKMVTFLNQRRALGRVKHK